MRGGLSDGFAALFSSRVEAQAVVAAFVAVPAVLVLARGEADGRGGGSAGWVFG